MKLELKHLAPYLPYGLKMKSIKNGQIKKIQGFGFNKRFGIYEIHYGKKKGYIKQIKSLKPILRPLADLTKKINHEGKIFIPLAEIFCIYPESSFVFEKRSDVVLTVWSNYEKCDSHGDFYLNPIIQKNEHQFVCDLYKWHFDVFGLIPKGLAIDINTLK